MYAYPRLQSFDHEEITLIDSKNLPLHPDGLGRGGFARRGGGCGRRG